jgi:bacterial/archaeal transporter family-2 protein
VRGITHRRPSDLAVPEDRIRNLLAHFDVAGVRIGVWFLVVQDDYAIHRFLSIAGSRRLLSPLVVTGSALAVLLSVVAGLAGAVQVSMMSQLGDRISIVGAVAFATLFTAVVSVVLLLVFRQSFVAYRDAFNHPWWMLMGGLLGLLIVFTITYAGGRLGVAATVGILIAGQLLMGAAIDRFGLFGSTKIPLHWQRVLGIALLGVGAALSLKK